MTETVLTFTDDWKYRTKKKLKETLGKDAFIHFTLGIVSDGYMWQVTYTTTEKLELLQKKAEQLKGKTFSGFRLGWYKFWNCLPRTIAYLSVRSDDIYILYKKISDDAPVKDFADKIRKEFNCNVELHFDPESKSDLDIDEIL